jgi:ring-1,2-phenylacetyl-CoA epoxidase subunit PaaB
MNNSLDPRINRLGEMPSETNVQPDEYWGTYEVFNQDKRGKHHVHVGSVHAPDPELALVFAKEQFGRRGTCVNMWVVKTTNIYAFKLEDEDMFSTIPDKQYREAGIYKVRDRIQAFQEKEDR